MGQLLKFLTRWAGATAIGFGGVGAVDILGKSNGQGQCSGAFRSQKHLGMCQTSALVACEQSFLYFLLTNDFVELHSVYCRDAKDKKKWGNGFEN